MWIFYEDTISRYFEHVTIFSLLDRFSGRRDETGGVHGCGISPRRDKGERAEYRGKTYHTRQGF